MFEEEFLLAAGAQEKSLLLETREKYLIENVVEPDPTPHHVAVYEAMRRKFGATWARRKSPSAYNCYGMVLANRRTSILEDKQLPKIFADDRLRIITEEEAQPGDLVFYRERSTAIGYLHAAVIVRRVVGDVGSALFALSKWNSTSGEDLHNIRHHCWNEGGYDVYLEFRTDRP